MPIPITSKQDLIRAFSSITLNEGYTAMSSLDFQFNEDDCLQCADCEAVEHPSQYYVERPITETDKGRFICRSCHEDLQRPERACSGCGIRLRHFNNPTPITYFHGGQEHEGEVCRECHGIGRFHRDYVPCGNCGSHDAAERFGEADGNHMCGRCLTQNYHFCPHCDEYHRNRPGGNKSMVPPLKIAAVETVDISRIIESEHLGLAAVV